VHRHLRDEAGRSGEASFIGVINRWAGARGRHWQVLVAVVAFVFLLAYACAQLVAGSKALHVLVVWPTWRGAVIGAAMVALYCMAGGIRASIWTDAAQSVVMIVAMALLLVSSVISLGGYSALVAEMAAIDGFLDLFPGDRLVAGVAGGVIFGPAGSASWSHWGPCRIAARGGGGGSRAACGCSAGAPWPPGWGWPRGAFPAVRAASTRSWRGPLWPPSFFRGSWWAWCWRGSLP